MADLFSFHCILIWKALSLNNMNDYQELLALEERIGNVNTGLNEETILHSMKQRKYLPFMIGAPSKLEPCCICQVRGFFNYFSEVKVSYSVSAISQPTGVGAFV